jgi:hypothetical protein
MTAAKWTMPVGLWGRLMVRLWLASMRIRIVRLLGWLGPKLACLVRLDAGRLGIRWEIGHAFSSDLIRRGGSRSPLPYSGTGGGPQRPSWPSYAASVALTCARSRQSKRAEPAGVGKPSAVSFAPPPAGLASYEAVK